MLPLPLSVAVTVSVAVSVVTVLLLLLPLLRHIVGEVFVRGQCWKYDSVAVTCFWASMSSSSTQCSPQGWCMPCALLLALLQA
jgi:hypothetical protein